MHIHTVQARQPHKNKVSLRNIYWKSNTLAIVQESQESTQTTSSALGSSNHEDCIGVCRALFIQVMVVDLVFGEGELFTLGVGVSPTLLSALWTLFSLLGCVTQPCYEGLCWSLLYLVVLCSVNVPRVPVLFWVEMRKRGCT